VSGYAMADAPDKDSSLSLVRSRREAFSAGQADTLGRFDRVGKLVEASKRRSGWNCSQPSIGSARARSREREDAVVRLCLERSQEAFLAAPRSA